MNVGDTKLQWVQQITYLGIQICCAKTFQVDLSDIRRKFFSSVNAILSKCNYTSDMVKLQLLESHCLPILAYAMESLHLSKPIITELNCWWNSIYRKIFNYHKWESVRELIFMLGRLDSHHIINLKSLKFLLNMSMHKDNSGVLISQFFHDYTCSSEYAAQFRLCGCRDDWSISKIKTKINLSFSMSRFRVNNSDPTILDTDVNNI